MNIEELIDNDVSEGPDIEYKHPDEEITDIAKELAAMANSGGGTIIVGIVENNGEIQSLVSVDNTGHFKEQVQQKVNSKLSPLPNVIHDSITYNGQCKKYCGTDLLSFSVDDDDRIYSYKEDNYHVIPTRTGQITMYMSGQQILDFYKNGYYPGRGPRNEEDSDSTMDEVLNDTMYHFRDSVTKPTQSQVDSQTGNTDQELPKFQTTQPNYFFTRTGEYTAVTFYNTLGLYQPHGFTGETSTVEIPDIKNILKSLQDHLNAQIEDGTFCIAQRNGAWFGYGGGNFIEALNREKRYETIPEDYHLDEHHSEGIIFFTRISEGYVIIRSRNGRGQDYIDEFNVSFLTEGIPLDNRDIIEFLENTGLSLQNGQSIDVRHSTFHPTGDPIQLETVERLESKHDEDWIGKIICKNPFKKDPDLLDSINEDIDTDYLDSFTTYQNVLCRLSDHHPSGEEREYYLRRANFQYLFDVQGSIPHLNASILGQW